MRKNGKILTLAVAAAVMMAVTACGTKDKTETTASTEAVTEAEDTTEAEETTDNKETAASGDDSTEAAEAADADTESEDAEAEGETGRNTVSAVGEIGADDTFKAADGRFEIKVPAGWSIDEDSDDEYVTFFSENGDDMLEIVNISGSAADSVREVYPDTAEQYKKMVSRDEGMEILSYDVNTKDDGSQTFRYSIKYPNPSDGIRFLAGSGAYDAATQTYTTVTGTVISSDDAVVKQVEEAVKSFKQNK